MTLLTLNALSAGAPSPGEKAPALFRRNCDRINIHFRWVCIYLSLASYRWHRKIIKSSSASFQYGGYSFAIVDAWPAEWAYTDDCYLDHLDGEYFLFDLLHPGVGVAIVVVL